MNLAIPAYLAAMAFTAQTPVEKECLVSLANAALGQTWVTIEDGRVRVEGETDPRLIISSGGAAQFSRFGVAPDPATERAIREYLRTHPEEKDPNYTTG